MKATRRDFVTSVSALGLVPHLALAKDSPRGLGIATTSIGILAMLALTYGLSRYNMRWIAFKSRRS